MLSRITSHAVIVFTPCYLGSRNHRLCEKKQTCVKQETPPLELLLKGTTRLPNTVGCCHSPFPLAASHNLKVKLLLQISHTSVLEIEGVKLTLTWRTPPWGAVLILSDAAMLLHRLPEEKQYWWVYPALKLEGHKNDCQYNNSGTDTLGLTNSCLIGIKSPIGENSYLLLHIQWRIMIGEVIDPKGQCTTDIFLN